MATRENLVFDAWMRLGNQAGKVLEAPETLAPALGDIRPLLRTWCYPSFEDHHVWLLWKETREESPALRLRRVTWNRFQEREDLAKVLDLEGFLKGAPTRLQVTDARVDGERWHDLEEEADSLAFPPLYFPFRKIVFVDGARYGIEQSFHEGSLRLEWRSVPPPEWALLARWTEKVRQFFEESLASEPE
ncbi:hypothetical protein [Corallococcus terminator]|uniref:Uncharacterized protein n=1 Tax=Corallococcus terminator TaxID=2316733 RepID=A0A3A8J7P8_9BACT|nr:hypothetical protein [Corallococcus terminator]RKG91689.1 hypothetical protein D7V88_08905 [Corallococcus terminator]